MTDLPYDALGFPVAVTTNELRVRLKSAQENKRQINNFIDAVVGELERRARATGTSL